MGRKYADILFALYINDGSAPISWLVDFLGRGTEYGAREIYEKVGALVSAKLLSLAIRDDEAWISLTESGAQAALATAEVLSGLMIEEWQQVRAL